VDPVSKVKGTNLVMFGSQVSLRPHYWREIKYTSQHWAVKKQWTAKWPYIANAIFRTV